MWVKIIKDKDDGRRKFVSGSSIEVTNELGKKLISEKVAVSAEARKQELDEAIIKKHKKIEEGDK